MIAKLTGTCDSLDADSAVIDVAGVGYLVSASARTLARLQPGRPAAVYVETQMREDRIQLFGFADAAERAWFRRLQMVQGVGGRVALALLSVLDPASLARAIAAQDRAALTRADGVGPRLAQRILAELKDKAVLDAGLAGIAAPAAAEAAGPVGKAAVSVPDDAVSALVNLGYGRSEAFGAVASAVGRLGTDAALDAVIRQGLKELARA
jgi:Holliday junction DNA helicase RuvA